MAAITATMTATGAGYDDGWRNRGYDNWDWGHRGWDDRGHDHWGNC